MHILNYTFYHSLIHAIDIYRPKDEFIKPQPCSLNIHPVAVAPKKVLCQCKFRWNCKLFSFPYSGQDNTHFGVFLTQFLADDDPLSLNPPLVNSFLFLIWVSLRILKRSIFLVDMLRLFPLREDNNTTNQFTIIACLNSHPLSFDSAVALV